MLQKNILKFYLIVMVSIFSFSVKASDEFDVNFQHQRTLDAIRAIYAGDYKSLDTMIGDVYIQHNFSAKDGRDAVLDFVKKGAQEGWLNKNLGDSFSAPRVVADGDLGALHYLDTTENVVYVDIFRFDQDGYIVEHWDVAQKLAPANKSGRTMVDGGGNGKADVSREQLEKNKAVVQRVMDQYFDKGDHSFLSEVMHPEYLQHNPHGADGLAYFSGLVERLGGRIENTVHALIAQGDLVFAHMHYPQFNSAAVDIFRFENGKIIEHWDVIQEIPATMPHDNGAF